MAPLWRNRTMILVSGFHFCFFGVTWIVISGLHGLASQWVEHMSSEHQLAWDLFFGDSIWFIYARFPLSFLFVLSILELDWCSRVSNFGNYHCLGIHALFLNCDRMIGSCNKYCLYHLLFWSGLKFPRAFFPFFSFRFWHLFGWQSVFGNLRARHWVQYIT
jgi:hypothetical protein